MQEAADLAEFRSVSEMLADLDPPSVYVAEDVGRNEKHGGPGYGVLSRAHGHRWYRVCMESRRVPAREWRQMSDEEQRAMIRAGIAEVEDLPEDFRREVEDMLAQHRSVPRSA